MSQRKNPPKGLFITDFDGTLLRSDGTVSQRDRDALAMLTRHGVKTAIATGRTLNSFLDSPGADLAVDYIIFTTGAAVVSKPGYELLYQVNLSADMVVGALERLADSSFDFMLHHAVPENHLYLYRRASNNNTDFESRINRRSEFGKVLESTHINGFGEAAQFVVVVPPESTGAALGVLRQEFSELSVVRATSPLDHASSWIELFHPDVSKGKTAAWLTAELGINHQNTIAIGNDYNDVDLLEWAAQSFVVGNAPGDLKNRFDTVCSNDEGGVAEAVERFLPL